jgi:hypothetical protein
MKALLFFFVFSLAGYQCFSQIDIFKSKPWKPSTSPPRQFLAPTTPVPENLKSTFPKSRSVLQLKVEMLKIGQINATTDLYKIEGYNMPCIAPSVNIKNNMPVMSELQKFDVSPDDDPVEK